MAKRKKIITAGRLVRGGVYTVALPRDDPRIHYHVVLNGTGNDYEIIRSLWIYGDDVDFEPIEVPGYTALAKYMTKEPREYGKVEVGSRTWTPSLGLKKPEADTGFVPDNMTLTAPPGAIILDRDENR